MSQKIVMAAEGGATKALSVEQFFSYLESTGGGGVNIQDLYGHVAWMFRATNMRADAISRIPFKVYDERNKEVEFSSIPLKKSLRLAEMDLCLSGAAYWYKEGNVKLRGVQRLNPWTMRTITKTSKGDGKSIVGISHFEQQAGNQTTPTKFREDEIVYFGHLYSPTDDLGPGVSPAQVCGLPAELVKNMNTYASRFFENGAIPAVVVKTESSLNKESQNQFERMWNQSLKTVSNAFKTMFLRRGADVKVIGSAISDLAMPDLEASAKRQISVSFGVPVAILEHAANSRSTAQTHRLSFWTETIIPEAELMQESINEQMMDELGLRLEFQYNEIEVLQQREYEKAQSVSTLLEQVNRSFMNTIIERDRANQIFELAFQQMGYPPPDLEPPDPVPIGIEDGGESKKVYGAAPPEVFQELARWRKAAPHKGKEFDSDVIPEWLSNTVKAGYELIGQDVFLFLKQEQSRDELEQGFQNKLKRALAKFKGSALGAVEKTMLSLFDFIAFTSAIQSVITPAMEKISTQRALELATEVGVQFDPAFINAEAAEWARSYAGELAKGLTDTTRSVLQKAISTRIENPDMTKADLVDLLAPAFGESRAEMLAVTEITRAYSEATNLYQRRIAEEGIQMSRIWHTAADDRVCPQCGPLDGKPEQDWPAMFADGPPAHPRCRCDTGLSARPLSYHRERAKELAEERVQLLETTPETSS